jgi:hypothetical protein
MELLLRVLDPVVDTVRVAARPHIVRRFESTPDTTFNVSNKARTLRADKTRDSTKRRPLAASGHNWLQMIGVFLINLKSSWRQRVGRGAGAGHLAGVAAAGARDRRALPLAAVSVAGMRG